MRCSRQGIDWLREKKLAKGIAAIAACFVLAVCGDSISAALPAGAGDAHRFYSRGIRGHHQPAAHVDSHHGRRLELFVAGVLLYALRGRRKVQLVVWALTVFLCDFALIFGIDGLPAGGFCLDADVHRLLRVVRRGGGAADAAV